MIDSGGDEVFSLNPVGLDLSYAYGPTAGPMISTLTGDSPSKIGRLAGTLYIGDYAVPHPIVQVTDELSAIGGGALKYFSATFDQAHDRVTFQRREDAPIAIPACRSTGLSFSEAPAYWRVVGVVPGSPGQAAGIEPGDLVTAVNGEPVSQWNARRYDRLVANAEAIDFTFLNGTSKADKRLKVVELVP
jgi:membrane-associated protease RseP (regulator of RpoE activity)